MRKRNGDVHPGSVRREEGKSLSDPDSNLKETEERELTGRFPKAGQGESCGEP